jgi:hypothetical protein
MTPEQNQAAWIAYEIAMDRWKGSPDPFARKPRLPLQLGTHIDSLPVEMNVLGTSNRLVPTRK